MLMNNEAASQKNEQPHPPIPKNIFLKMDLTPWEEPSFYDQLDNTTTGNKSERKFL